MLKNISTKLEQNETKIEAIPREETRLESPHQASNVSMGDLKTFQDYSVVKQLSTKGAESDIYVIQKNNINYILKYYRLGIEPKKEVLSKLEQLSRESPNEIVKIYKTGFDEESKRWFEIQEYIENGSLREFKEKINTEKLYQIIEAILNILHAIHSKNIIHRDIKPENILIRSYQPLNLVITDFGISSLEDDATNILTNKQGTHKYFSPESFTGVISQSVDYWSLGMIIYELANNGKHYFDGISDTAVHHNITTKEIVIPSDFDENIKQLLNFLFVRNPKNRGNYEIVRRWLDGEDIGEAKPDDKPLEDNGYSFDGKKYSEFDALAKRVSMSYKNWINWRNHLEDGGVLEWCDKHEQYQKRIDLKKIEDNNLDLMVLKFIYTFNTQLKDFLLFGKLININNLQFFIQSSSSSSENKGIYHCLIDGSIREFYRTYLELTKTEDKYSWLFDEIYGYMKKEGVDGLSKRTLLGFLNFLNHQDEYLLPSNYEKLVNILNFHYFSTKESLLTHNMISSSIIEVLPHATFDEHKRLTKLLKMDLTKYYYPNDFFQNLEENFSDTIMQVDSFVKKSSIKNMEKRYYIPDTTYIDNIKNSPSEIYLKAYRDLKILKKETLLLKTQLEEAKEQREFFLEHNINIDKASMNQFKEIKKILNLNIDFSIYPTLIAINKKRKDRDLKSYLLALESFNIRWEKIDSKIVNFIKNYKMKLYSARVVFILSILSMIIALQLFPHYLFSFIVLFAFVTLSYILIVSKIVNVPTAFIRRIEKVAKVEYVDSKELPTRLISFDNGLVNSIVWLSVISLIGWLIYWIVSLISL